MMQGDPPLVYGIKWNPVERPDLKGKYPDNKDCAFVTFGSKHLYFWSTNGSKDGRPINTELTGVGTCVLRDGEAIKGRFMKKEKLDATTSGEKEVAATKEKNNDIQARNYCNCAPENRRNSLRNSLTPIPPHDIQDVLCVEFLRNGAVVSGMPDGEVYYWLPSDTEDMGLEVRNSDAILRNSVAIL